MLWTSIWLLLTTTVVIQGTLGQESAAQERSAFANNDVRLNRINFLLSEYANQNEVSDEILDIVQELLLNSKSAINLDLGFPTIIRNLGELIQNVEALVSYRGYFTQTISDEFLLIEDMFTMLKELRLDSFNCPSYSNLNRIHTRRGLIRYASIVFRRELTKTMLNKIMSTKDKFPLLKKFSSNFLNCPDYYQMNVMYKSLRKNKIKDLRTLLDSKLAPYFQNFTTATKNYVNSLSDDEKQEREDFLNVLEKYNEETDTAKKIALFSSVLYYDESDENENVTTETSAGDEDESTTVGAKDDIDGESTTARAVDVTTDRVDSSTIKDQDAEENIKTNEID